MKLQKTIFYSLSALMICSFTFSLITNAYSFLPAEIVFRGIFTGCIVGSITSLILYFQNKSDILNRLNEQLIETHLKLVESELVFENLIKEINAEQNHTPQYIDWVIIRIEEFTNGFSFSMFLLFNYKPFLFDSKKNNKVDRIIKNLTVNISSVSAQASMARLLFLNINSKLKTEKTISDEEIVEAINKLTELKKSIAILYEFAKDSNSYVEVNFHNVTPYMSLYNFFDAFQKTKKV